MLTLAVNDGQSSTSRLWPLHALICFYRDTGEWWGFVWYCGQWCATLQLKLSAWITGITPFMKQSWFGLKKLWSVMSSYVTCVRNILTYVTLKQINSDTCSVHDLVPREKTSDSCNQVIHRMTDFSHYLYSCIRGVTSVELRRVTLKLHQICVLSAPALDGSGADELHSSLCMYFHWLRWVM